MESEIKIQNEIINSILESKQAIESLHESQTNSKNILFLAFWDFDGTILKGDCSEGLIEDGVEGFKGLVELGILNGLAKGFQGELGVKEFWKKYREMELIDKEKAYIFLPQIFVGNKESEMLKFASSHFQNVLQKFYFKSSIQILEKLNSFGVQSHIVSASADFFVKGCENTISIKKDSIFGIEMETVNDVLSEKEKIPVTYADGKRVKMKLVVEEISKEKKADFVYLLAGFGNSFHTDGQFLKYIAEQNMEVGKPISVMINGGEAPEEYKGTFKEVSFSKLI